MLWTDENITGLEHLDHKAYSKEPTSFGKCDIVRGALLYQYGGVYIDADSLWVNGHCLNDIAELASVTGMLAALEPKKNHLANGVMFSVKHHPVIKWYMYAQTILSHGVLGDDQQHAPWQILGPGAITAAYHLANNNVAKDWCRKPKGTKASQQTDVVLADSLVCLSQEYYTSGGVLSDLALATVLGSKYFYPESWVGLADQKTDVSHVEHISKNFPEALIFQFGLSTNGFSSQTWAST